MIKGMLELIYVVPIKYRIDQICKSRVKLTKMPLIDQTLTKLTDSQMKSKIHQPPKFFILHKINVFEHVFQYWPWFDQNFDRSIEINLSSY